MIRDISQINRESFRLLVESVEDYAIFIIDEQGYIISWNRGAEQINGYMADEIIGEHISIFYTPEDIERNEAATSLKRTSEAGRYECEGWRVRKDGSVFWANVISTAMQNDQGDLVGFGMVVRDLTKSRKAEAEIRRVNNELTALLQKSRSETLDYRHALDESAIVAITNQKGIITHVNDNFCKISKYPREELIGHDHRIINSGFHSRDFIREIWTTIANGNIWRGELKNKAKDGSYYWVDTTIVPFLNEKGKPYQYLAIRSDITQRKLAEEQLVSLNEDLERRIRERTLELTEALQQAKELNEIKTHFVSLASHEFRTPLSVILSSVSLLDNYLTPEHEEKRTKHMDRIKSSVKNLTNILDGFLSVEKLDQGKVETHNSSFDLPDFLQEITEEMEGVLRKKSQTISLAECAPIKLYQDKAILRNVLLNLLSNAVKYSPEEKNIEVSMSLNDSIVCITVKDEGIGIPEEAQKNMFSKFFRADNAVHIQGTGLGLNIVKKYVELLDGSISFISREHEGTAFTVSFPAVRADR